eukprot:m51a1_g7895 hypothetical protein (705) ;mRNA; f:104194-115408
MAVRGRANTAPQQSRDIGESLEQREHEELMEQLGLLVRLQSEQMERVSVVCDAEWMDANRLGTEAIRSACSAAAVRLEGDVHGPDVGPCTRCCGQRPKKLIAVEGLVLAESRPMGSSRERVFAFTQCKSHCNSSRLHVGGRVVVVVTVRGPLGPLAEAVSEPLALTSRSTYIHRPRSLLHSPSYTWDAPVELLRAAGASDAPGPEGSETDETAELAVEETSMEHNQAQTAAPQQAISSGDPGRGREREELMAQVELLVRLQSEQMERVRVVCDAAWMERNRLGTEAIKTACAAASVRKEGDESGADLGPCTRCCATRPKRPITIGGFAREEPPESSGGKERVFVFDRCKSTSWLWVDGHMMAVVKAVSVVCDAAWMERNRLGAEAIKAACAAASVRLEGGEHGPDLGPCARCCAAHPRRLATIGGQVEQRQTADGRGRVFVFDRCKSHCNTSRLHVGGRVVVVVTVSVVCDAAWMEHNRLGTEAIKAACAAASVRKEGDDSGEDLGPCTRCCATRPKRPITIGGFAREEPPESSGGKERVFVFDRCKSHCNTSRLHVGGRVVVVVTVRGPLGPLAEALSEPLTLVSRSSYLHRPRALFPAPSYTWDAAAEALGAADASDVPEGSAAVGTKPRKQREEVHKASVNQSQGPAEEPPQQQAHSGAESEQEREREELMAEVELLVRLQSEQMERVRLLQLLVHSDTRL